MTIWPKNTNDDNAAASRGTNGNVAPAQPPSTSKLNDVSFARMGTPPADPALPRDPTAPAGSVHQPPAQPLTPEQKKDAAMASKLLMAGFGEIVSVLLRAKDYRAKPIAELEAIAIPAVLTGQFSLAQAQSALNGLTSPVGVVFWARVSPEVDQRLTEKIETEPVRLHLPEWRSGAILWIVDAVGEHKVVEAMLSRLLETEWKGQDVRLRARTKDGDYKVGLLGRRSDAQQTQGN